MAVKRFLPLLGGILYGATNVPSKALTLDLKLALVSPLNSFQLLTFLDLMLFHLGFCHAFSEHKKMRTFIADLKSFQSCPKFCDLTKKLNSAKDWTMRLMNFQLAVGIAGGVRRGGRVE